MKKPKEAFTCEACNQEKKLIHKDRKHSLEKVSVCQQCVREALQKFNL